MSNIKKPLETITPTIVFNKRKCLKCGYVRHPDDDEFSFDRPTKCPMCHASYELMENSKTECPICGYESIEKDNGFISKEMCPQCDIYYKKVADNKIQSLYSVRKIIVLCVLIIIWYFSWFLQSPYQYDVREFMKRVFLLLGIVGLVIMLITMLKSKGFREALKEDFFKSLSKRTWLDAFGDGVKHGRLRTASTNRSGRRRKK
jgi:predicted Zn-ribbon and HTH transcriptional regulator